MCMFASSVLRTAMNHMIPKVLVRGGHDGGSWTMAHPIRSSEISLSCFPGSCFPCDAVVPLLLIICGTEPHRCITYVLDGPKGETRNNVVGVYERGDKVGGESAQGWINQTSVQYLMKSGQRRSRRRRMTSTVVRSSIPILDGQQEARWSERYSMSSGLPTSRHRMESQSLSIVEITVLLTKPSIAPTPAPKLCPQSTSS